MKKCILVNFYNAGAVTHNRRFGSRIKKISFLLSEAQPYNAVVNTLHVGYLVAVMYVLYIAVSMEHAVTRMP
jgi:hypothetical protein